MEYSVDTSELVKEGSRDFPSNSEHNQYFVSTLSLTVLHVPSLLQTMMRTSSPGDRVSFYKPGYQRDSADLRQGIPSREILPTLAACLMEKCKYLKHFFFDVNLNLLRNFNLSDCVWETTCCHVEHESSHYQQPAGCSSLVKSKSQIQNLLSHFTVFPLFPGSPPC